MPNRQRKSRNGNEVLHCAKDSESSSLRADVVALLALPCLGPGPFIGSNYANTLRNRNGMEIIFDQFSGPLSILLQCPFLFTVSFS